MAAKLAMVAVDRDFEGPWIRAQGSEKAIEIAGLGEGESVTLESETDRQLNLPEVFRSNGTFSFPQCTKFRIIKQAAGRSPTFVRIVW